MKKKILKQRASAVQRYLAGEDTESICASPGKTTRWLYKWIAIKEEIELDETCFRGRRKWKRGRGVFNKVPVFGILERNGLNIPFLLIAPFSKV